MALNTPFSDQGINPWATTEAIRGRNGRGRCRSRGKSGVFQQPASGMLCVTDVASFWDEPVEVELHAPAELRSVVLLDKQDVVREIRMSPVVDGVYEVREIGELYVAFSLAIACDRDSWSHALGAMDEEQLDQFQVSLNEKALIDAVRIDGCPDGLLFRAAADGYVVSALLEGGARVVGCLISAL
ncbi:MAG: hypothetical protein H6724_07120 [Sandaracinus sp.]|nr:hypothetical protein [Sandaracinus sp.]